jgi:hypothetical protein
MLQEKQGAVKFFRDSEKLNQSRKEKRPAALRSRVGGKKRATEHSGLNISATTNLCSELKQSYETVLKSQGASVHFCHVFS